MPTRPLAVRGTVQEMGDAEYNNKQRVEALLRQYALVNVVGQLKLADPPLLPDLLYKCLIKPGCKTHLRNVVNGGHDSE